MKNSARYDLFKNDFISHFKKNLRYFLCYKVITQLYYLLHHPHNEYLIFPVSHCQNLEINTFYIAVSITISILYFGFLTCIVILWKNNPDDWKNSWTKFDNGSKKFTFRIYVFLAYINIYFLSYYGSLSTLSKIVWDFYIKWFPKTFLAWK